MHGYHPCLVLFFSITVSMTFNVGTGNSVPAGGESLTLDEVVKKLDELTELTAKQSAEIEDLKDENEALQNSASVYHQSIDHLQAKVNFTNANVGLTEDNPYSAHSNYGTECYTEADGSDYRGVVATTVSGLICQKWTEQSPHEHTSTPNDYPDAGLGDHNYCRNPDGAIGPWCYTTDSSVRYEFCDVGEISSTCSDSGFQDHSGAVYTRWGHSSCPGNSELVYTGMTGGDYYNTKGGAARYLCMPQVPVYDEAVEGVSISRAYVYATEYELHDGPLGHLGEHDAPCAVCRVPLRSVVLMVPGRNDCPSHAWTREYYGFLVANKQYAGWRSTEYICLDRNAQTLPGTSANTNGALLYYVEGRCLAGGGLPCGPYIDGNELTCAVCTM